MSDASALVKDSAAPRGGEEADYLAALGQRVRHLRALRGMSRKVLSKASGISERYLAQLESGQGNLSITLLRRAARAIGCPLEELTAGSGAAAEDWREFRAALASATPQARAAALAALTPAPSPAPGAEGSGPRIALIGLRGAGKSTLGALAGETLKIGRAHV